MKMLNVMIVDDEPMAIDYLNDLISWHDNGFEIVAKPTNAKEAIQCFKEKRPQIVISDICLPGVNGLELCRKILSLDNTVHIIMLTAYSEFTYAKQAIELGASDYILKHELSGKTLLRQLEKVRNEIERQNDTSKIIKKHVIQECLDQQGEKSGNLYKSWEILDGDGGTFILMLIREDTIYPLLDDEGENTFTSGERIDDAGSLYSDLPDDLEYIDEFILRNNYTVRLFKNKKYISERSSNRVIYPIACQTQKLLEQKSGHSYSIIINSGISRTDQIPKIYNDSLKAAKYLSLFEKDKINFFQDLGLHYQKDDDRYDIDGIFKSMIEYLNKLDWPSLVTEIHDLFQKILIPSFTHDKLRYCCDKFMDIVETFAKNNYLPDLESKEVEKLCGTRSCYTIYDIEDTFVKLIKYYSDEMLDVKINGYSKKVKDAVKFMHENYNRNISIADVADELKISESNLAKSFKAQTGESVLGYLTEIRIKDAKYLLRNSNMKVHEISEYVGYATSQYFSQVFMRKVGMNPNEYRERKY